MKQWINACSGISIVFSFVTTNAATAVWQLFFSSIQHRNIVSFSTIRFSNTERIAREISTKISDFVVADETPYLRLQSPTNEKKNKSAATAWIKIKINRKVHTNRRLLWNCGSFSSLDFLKHFIYKKLHGKKIRYRKFHKNSNKKNMPFPWVCFVHPKEHDKFLRSLSLSENKKTPLNFMDNCLNDTYNVMIRVQAKQNPFDNVGVFASFSFLHLHFLFWFFFLFSV